MTLFHAVVWMDHHRAQVLQFDTEQVQVHKVQSHQHDTGQHGSAVRSEHEFFGEVCDELADIAQIVVTGSKTALADFHHYVDKHCAPLVPHIVGWETVDHPSEAQLVAFARKYFVDRERMSGITIPMV